MPRMITTMPHEHGHGADDDPGAQVLLLETEEAEEVERERGEHLAGDEEPDGGEGAEPWEEQDAAGDVERTGESAKQLPGLDVGQFAERAECSGRHREHGQQTGRDAELDGRGAVRGADGRVELEVHRGLDGQEAADQQGRGEERGMHLDLPGAGMASG